MNTGDGHKSQIDGLRCLAILTVFVFHIYYLRMDGIPFIFGKIPMPYLGLFGVELFFVISGFLISRIILSNDSGDLLHDLKTFYVRRVLRIFPIYYCVIIAMHLSGILPYPMTFYMYTYNWVMYFAQPPVGPYTLFWTLCIEEQFYLIIPLLLLKTKREWRIYMLFAVLVLLNVLQFLMNQIYPDRPGHYLMSEAGQYLIWGCIAGYFDLKLKSKNWSGALVFFTGVVLVLAWMTILSLNDKVDLLHWGSLVTLLHSFGLALVVVGLWKTKSKILLAPFQFKPIAYLGKISYGFYVYHAILIKFAYDISAEHAGGISLVLTILAASLSWKFFESPINDLKRHFPYKKRTETAKAQDFPIDIQRTELSPEGGT